MRAVLLVTALLAPQPPQAVAAAAQAAQAAQALVPAHKLEPVQHSMHRLHTTGSSCGSGDVTLLVGNCVSDDCLARSRSASAVADLRTGADEPPVEGSAAGPLPRLNELT
jgi:hypothetical protein